MGIMMVVSGFIVLLAWGVVFSAPPPVGRAFCFGWLFPILILSAAAIFGCMLPSAEYSDINGLINLATLLSFGTVTIASGALVGSALMHLSTPRKYVLSVQIALGIGIVYALLVPVLRLLAVELKH